MKSVNITSAKAHLSSLLKQVEEKDQEVIIERSGTPIAKLIKYKPIRIVNRIGKFKNQISITEDFDVWPDELAIKLGVKD
jgi:prevent-host-death family protein